MSCDFAEHLMGYLNSQNVWHFKPNYKRLQWRPVAKPSIYISLTQNKVIVLLSFDFFSLRELCVLFQDSHKSLRCGERNTGKIGSS